MAVRVNDEGIPLSDYENELRRYQDALAQKGEEYAAEVASAAVLEMLVSQTLLAQGALQQGYASSEEGIQSKYQELADEVGGEDALRSWMAANHYDDDSFRRALEKDLAATWMRNQIIIAVPDTAPQVRARQVQLRNENQIIAVERQLQTGTPFETLAYQYDPLTGGDLGWFPRGYLLQPDVENAAFALNPGEFSPIIQTSYGYHIVAVIEKNDAHPLSSDALMFVRRQALRDWLADRRAQSAIEQYIP
jgi:peptidyl-prolyl cis-trans isomerase C